MGLDCDCANAWWPSGTTSNPLWPRSAGRAAVSSRVFGRRASLSSKSASRSVLERGRGPGMHVGGFTKLLKRNWGSDYQIPSVTDEAKNTHRAITIYQNVGAKYKGQHAMPRRQRYGRKTYTRREKPRTCNIEMGNNSFSQPRPRLIIQIASVLQVSVNDRAVALT